MVKLPIVRRLYDATHSIKRTLVTKWNYTNRNLEILRKDDYT